MSYKEYISSDVVQEKLIEVAFHGRDQYSRGSAIRKICSHEILLKLLKEDPNPFIRSEAALKVTDQIILGEKALNDPDPQVRKSCLKNLKDEMIITKISLNDTIGSVRETAVKLIKKSEGEILGIIALQDPHWPVRYAATWKLEKTNETEDILKKIAMNDTNENVRKVAVEKIQDQGLLFNLGLYDQSVKVKITAVKKITHQDLLQKIVELSELGEIREIVIQKITDQTFLRKIALIDPHIWVREAATHRLDKSEYSQKILHSIAINDVDENVRATAIEKIINQSLLTDVVLNCKYPGSCRYAISLIGNKEELTVLRLTAHSEFQNIIRERLKEITL